MLETPGPRHELPAATDESFERDALLSPIPVLVTFWAPWCSPCEVLLPTLAHLADRYRGRLRLLRVDVDRCPSAAARLGITSLPTVVLLDAGVPRFTTTGIRPLEEYERLLTGALRT